ncbi:DUF5658 family protein [Paenibacillus phytorum]|uniref:DUF5658 family protein n=1 Tax=Paenibacillus phytorum TaxID=2654977 RepID=UPI0035E46134
MDVVRQFFISKTLIWLLFLCCTDAIFTDIGLHLAFIEELNPLIRSIYEWHVRANQYSDTMAVPIWLLAKYECNTTFPRLETSTRVKR